MQLVSNKVRLFDPMKSKVIGEREVIEKFGVKPEQVIDIYKKSSKLEGIISL